jgi:hypothetical protein
MSVLNNSAVIGLLGAPPPAAAGGISRSLRFNSSDSAYLSRTPASAGDRRKFTFAAWVKIASLTAGQNVLFSVTDGTTPFAISWQSDGALVFGNLSFAWKETTAKLRDYSAWYHICVSVDTDQASNANRLKFYVNGAQQTDFSTNRDLYLNTNIAVNGAFTHEIGRYSAGSNQYFNGLLADVFFIDGQQLTPSSFTETDATTGQLIPKAFSASYGSQGWHLEFADNSSNTATTLGKDTSGLGNNWTPNNLSVTAGAGNDSLVDVPTNGAQTDTGVGGEVRGNYCTWNSLAKGSDCTLSNGNLDVAWGTAGSTTQGSATFGMSSGKWYWETTITASSASPTNAVLGITTKPFGDSEYPGYTATSWGYRGSDGQKWNNTSGASYGASYANGDVIGVAFDADNGTLTFYKNGSSQGTAFSSLTSGPYFPAIGDQSSSQTFSAATNFGQRPFAYTAPSGFKALCTANLPAPLVTKPSTVMDVKLYTGNGSTQTISGLGFSPDFLWIKSRSTTYDHQLADVVRGVGNILHSNLTSAESTLNTITATTSDGFTVDATSYIGTNANGQTFAAWAWDAGSSTVTNTQGSITSSVRANATAGFSIVTFTMGSGSFTVGHGLGAAPTLLITKARSNSSSWWTYHTSLGTGSYLALNSTAAAASDYSWGSAPTSTVFTANNNFFTNGYTYVVYCFAPVVGYSSFGSYTGNGSTDGPFVYTGFRVKWYLVKQSSASGENWRIIDATRSPYNVAQDRLLANSSAAEGAQPNEVDFLSNGFKFRSSDSAYNGSGATYIYAAFAESPFNYARAR